MKRRCTLEGLVGEGVVGSWLGLERELSLEGRYLDSLHELYQALRFCEAHTHVSRVVRLTGEDEEIYCERTGIMIDSDLRRRPAARPPPPRPPCLLPRHRQGRRCARRSTRTRRTLPLG